MLTVLSNAQLEEATAEEASLNGEGPDALQEETLTGLAGYITKCWEAARTNKQTLVLENLRQAQRMRRGEYDPAKLAQIRSITGGSEEYGRVVSNKCRIAESWLRDVYLGQTEPPWVLEPTPVPELTPTHMEEVQQTLQQEILEVVGKFGVAPPEDVVLARRNELTDGVRMRVREEAKISVERMADKMEDQLVQGDFRIEWADFLNDIVTYSAAHFKGPIYKKNTELVWDRKDGSWSPVAHSTVIPTWKRIDPFRAYPSPGALSPQDGYFIEHITLERTELYNTIELPGYSEKEVRAVLEEAEAAGLINWLGLTDAAVRDSDQGDLHFLSPQSEIDALEFTGPVRGTDLLDWGMSSNLIKDKDKDYEVTAWLIGRHVIKVQLNPDPLGRRPIFKGCWEEIPGEYWGQGLPDGLKDIDGITNAAIRSLVNNMAMASGPQVAINTGRLPPGENIQSLTPWRIWQFLSNEYATNEKPIDFFQPNINAREILEVLERFYRYADDWSLIPRYMGGSDNIAGGIGRTASGMSMLFNAANKGLKGVVSNVDLRVLAPMLTLLYAHNMILEDDDTLKGDAQIVAKGAVALLQIETLQLRRNEFLTATANPIDMQVVGLEGRKEILREIAKGLDMDVNRIVPRRGTAPQLPAAPGGASGQEALSKPNEEQLFTGAAVTDNFSPNSMRSAV